MYIEDLIEICDLLRKSGPIYVFCVKAMQHLQIWMVRPEARWNMMILNEFWGFFEIQYAEKKRKYSPQFYWSEIVKIFTGLIESLCFQMDANTHGISIPSFLNYQNVGRKVHALKIANFLLLTNTKIIWI